jgi:RimJ/RimL family protein N-acetyltransferase
VNEPARFAPVADARPSDTAWPQLKWPITAQTALAGATVRLTPVDPEGDAAELYSALDHDGVWAYLTGGRPADVAGYAERLREQCADPLRQHWTVRTTVALNGLPAGAVAGTTSYCNVVPQDAHLEIGFTQYTPASWGSLVNPECKLLLLSHAFDVLGAGRVQFKCDVRNVRSQQAIARLGATYEGTLRRYQRRADGTVRDSLLFSIIAEDWPAVRDRLHYRLNYGADHN